MFNGNNPSQNDNEKQYQLLMGLKILAGLNRKPKPSTVIFDYNGTNTFQSMNSFQFQNYPQRFIEPNQGLPISGSNNVSTMSGSINPLNNNISSLNNSLSYMNGNCTGRNPNSLNCLQMSQNMMCPNNDFHFKTNLSYKSDFNEDMIYNKDLLQNEQKRYSNMSFHAFPTGSCNKSNNSRMSYTIEDKERTLTNESFYKNFMTPNGNNNSQNHNTIPLLKQGLLGQNNQQQNQLGRNIAIDVLSPAIPQKIVSLPEDILLGNKTERRIKSISNNSGNSANSCNSFVSNKKLFSTLKTKRNVRPATETEDGKQFLCEHPNCESKHRTNKQKLLHHNKMNPECKTDTNTLIKLISKAKRVLLSLVDKTKFYCDPALIEIKRKYEEVMTRINNTEYAESTSGLLFEYVPEN